jgi:transcriptional regulator with XRE-family HTH domain
VLIGKRIRTQPLFLGMSQDALAIALGVTFQQVQKYELGANRLNASRLSAIADVLRVPVSFFFARSQMQMPIELAARMKQPETIKLLRSYWAIPVRRQFLRDVKALKQQGESM